MSYLVLARKYRPQTFEEVINQRHVIQTLTNAIVMDRVPHAILFSGPRGTGKTTVARILAKAMNCASGPTKTPCNVCNSCHEITVGSSVDVYEIDGASNNGVDQVRELRENAKYMPSHSKYKIYIIDEVHMLSTAAFNALLKTLEEPPSHIMFVFATTEPHKIPLTILSRCQRHDFKRIDIESLSDHLKSLCNKEGVGFDDESLFAISREAGGSVRDAVSLLDHVIACNQGDMTHKHVVEILGVADQTQMFNISNAIFKPDIREVLEIIDQIYDRGYDIKKFYSDLIMHFRNMIIVKMAGGSEKLIDLSKNEIDALKDQLKDIPLTYLNQILDFLFSIEANMRYSDHPKISLETAFIKMLQMKPVLPIDDLIKKIDILRNEFSGQITNQLKDSLSDYGNIEEKTYSGQNQETRKPDADQFFGQILETTETADEADEDLETKWNRLYEVISKKHPSIAANLVHSRLISVNDKSIEIEVNGNGFNINMVKKDKNLAILQEICSSFFGKKIGVIVHEKKNKDLARRKETMNGLKQDALNHPLIADAVEIFKGEIIDVKVLTQK